MLYVTPAKDSGEHIHVRERINMRLLSFRHEKTKFVALTYGTPRGRVKVELTIV